MIPHKDAAVSPVVGVMLMLVVTIIIAAVVSAFSGGLAGTQHKTPQTTLAVKGIIKDIQDTDTTNWISDYPAGFTAANGLQFENTGGDTFSLSDIQIQLQYTDAKYTITPADTLPTTTALPAGITNGGYFQKIGNSSVRDTSIAPGDKFMLYADNCRIDTYGKQISWKPSGASGGFGSYLNTKLQYKVIDTASSRVITSGEIYLVQ